MQNPLTTKQLAAVNAARWAIITIADNLHAITNAPYVGPMHGPAEGR